MADRRDKDPFLNYNFVVEIDGIQTAGFKEVSGLDSKIEVVDYREGGEMGFPARKLPGKVTYSNVVLKVGVTTSTELFDWHMQWVRSDAAAARKNLSVVLRHRNGETEVRRWNIREAWPANYMVSGLNGEGKEVLIQTLELAHEGINLE